jgi:ribonuclease E
MSAEPYDADPAAMPHAQAAVDILPVQSGRKVRQPEPEAVQPAVDPAWAQPAPTTNPWTGVADASPPTEQPVAAQGVPQQPVADPAPAQPPATVSEAPSGPTPLVYAGAIPPPVSVPVVPGAGVPVVTDPAESEAGAPAAKRFLGMQLRRPRKADGTPLDEPDAQSDGPAAPVAAWPTDVGVGVVATAEPDSPAPWGPPVGFAATDASGIVHEDLLPLPVPEAPAPEPAAQPVAEPVLAEPAAPLVVDPAGQPVAVDAAPVVQVAPLLPAPPADDELRSLRTMVEAADARRTAAEHRADNAVLYAQQLQSELTRVQSELEAKLQASEVRVRSTANEAQDWQIRHREAQTQITELAASLAGAEQRLADVRAERDDLMSQLEDATSPDREAVAEQLES